MWWMNYTPSTDEEYEHEGRNLSIPTTAEALKKMDIINLFHVVWKSGTKNVNLHAGSCAEHVLQ